MTVTAIPAVVTPDWLKDRLHEVKVLDTSWYLPSMGRNALQEYQAARLPGAQFWDIDGVCDTLTDLPHMLPGEEAFAAAADALGISHEDAVVVYDGLGMFAAPRAWWTWRVFGHDRVAVLEGGLPAWRAAGLPVDESAVSPGQATIATKAARTAGPGTATNYKAALKREKVVHLADMLKLVKPAAAAGGQQPVPKLARQVVDARPSGRFKGVDPEPRPGLRLGHMPGANNVPFVQVYAGEQVQGAKLKSVDELEQTFNAAGVDVQSPIICSCGSGLTACILALAQYQVTGQLASVYDGAWCEWGSLAETPIVGENDPRQV
eukprot:GHRR01010341.1.p1 GENE.GHRR01010341.1~~GHRR01010341.1.p1  ORF type:complete len:320 (+),score=104.57 GHRR01010341.1:296-1255(+)